MTETRNRTEYMKQYRAAHLEHKTEYMKQYNASHVEEKKQYYQNGKEQQLNRQKVPATCDRCGCISSVHNLARHQTSKKCQSFIKEQLICFIYFHQ